ncbi:cyd operon protein YbgE [Vibrio cholerae]|uniref:cyd operon protein YbgE n=1 Tax=Vibrio cholerae TaxID=666 RepID=UPI0018F0BDC3|nr:cyd operon protein YbgE [Vibrio cholerae]MBJ6885607.1 cyd operon protein YbgE [Vibrio cholerae]
MSDWQLKSSEKIARCHDITDKALLKALSLLLGFYNAAMVMWDPNSYADRIGGFNAVIAPLMIWAICASMVFGVGFRPRHWVWQIVFSPYLSLPILSYLTLVQLIS